MPKKKPRDPPYWLTGPKGGKSANGKPLPFVPLYADLLQSEQFQALSRVDRLVYIAMGLEAKTFKDFKFPESTAKLYGFSGMALRRSVQDLVERGSSRLLRTTGHGESRMFTALRWTGSSQRKPHHLAKILRIYNMALQCSRLFYSLVITWCYGKRAKTAKKCNAL